MQRGCGCLAHTAACTVHSLQLCSTCTISNLQPIAGIIIVIRAGADDNGLGLLCLMRPCQQPLGWRGRWWWVDACFERGCMAATDVHLHLTRQVLLTGGAGNAAFFLCSCSCCCCCC